MSCPSDLLFPSDSLYPYNSCNAYTGFPGPGNEDFDPCNYTTPPVFPTAMVNPTNFGKVFLTMNMLDGGIQATSYFIPEDFVNGYESTLEVTQGLGGEPYLQGSRYGVPKPFKIDILSPGGTPMEQNQHLNSVMLNLQASDYLSVNYAAIYPTAISSFRTLYRELWGNRNNVHHVDDSYYFSDYDRHWLITPVWIMPKFSQWTLRRTKTFSDFKSGATLEAYAA